MRQETLNYVGWKGYDSFLEAGGYPKKNEFKLQKSFISTADEIITKLRFDSSQIDLCTTYFIYFIYFILNAVMS
jgi:spermidine/putrescine transport system substrate-binding protein